MSKSLDPPNKGYYVQTTRGELLEIFPFTVDGFYDAMNYHLHRNQNERDSELHSTENIDYDNPSGLSAKEKEILHEMYGELP